MQALRRRANIYVMPRCSAFQISDNAAPQPHGLVAVWFGLTGLSVIVLALLAYRMTIGVDLSDELYYATFLDGWLKDGLGHSENLALQQSAALLILPAAQLYTWFAGSERGLMLFLRFIFLAMAGIASLCQYWFISCVRGKAVAWSAALLVLCFIPFSLSAPSYNTIGMFGMLSALALFGAATLQRPQAKYSAVAAILSGLAWMAAVIAYPTMPVVLLAFLALALLAARDRSERLHLLGYAMICLAFQFCGAWLLLQLYGWSRIWQILQFTSGAMQNSEYMSAKFARSLDLFVSHPAFDMLCLAAVAVGIWLLVAGRDRRRDVWPGLLLWAIVLASYCTETALWFHPHDIVVLLALAGLFVMRSFGGAEGGPVIRVIYLASLVGGLVTSVTSSNGFYNFPIGGLAAAALAPAMLVPRDAPWKAVAGQCGLLLSTAVLFCTSAFASVYGETSNPLTAPALRVKDGVFAGLLTTTDQAAFITAATAVLGEQVGRGKTIVVMGRPPAIYLLTDASPMTLSTWDFWQFYGSLPPWVNALTEAFYRVSVHRPDVVAVFNDPQTYPLAPWARDLLANYVAVDRVSVGSRTLSIYKLCNTPACPAPTIRGARD